MKFYLAYGSNLDLDHMNNMCPNSKFIGITSLYGYKLAFRGNEGRSYLTLIKDSEASTYVGIFSITDSCETSLDYYEDYPDLYYKENITIKYDSEEVNALIYIMNENEVFNKPKTTYFEMVLNAYKYHDLDNEVLYNALNNK